MAREITDTPVFPTHYMLTIWALDRLKLKVNMRFNEGVYKDEVNQLGNQEFEPAGKEWSCAVDLLSQQSIASMNHALETYGEELNSAMQSYMASPSVNGLGAILVRLDDVLTEYSEYYNDNYNQVLELPDTAI